MGEDRSATRRRLTVAQAAEALGISVDAVRGRIKRATLDAEHTPEGVFVWLDADQVRPAADQPTNQPADQALIVTRLENEVQFLREELARKDAILLSMTEAMKALNPPAAETPSEARESPEPRSKPGLAPTPTPADDDPQSGAEPTAEPTSEARRAWLWWWVAWLLLLVILAPAIWLIINWF